MDRICGSKLWISLISFFIGYITHQFIYLVKKEQVVFFEEGHAIHLVKSGSIDTFLVILIFSSVNNFSKRQTIRETWAANLDSNKDVRYYFVISGAMMSKELEIKIQEEEKKYYDLLIFKNLEDSFYHLSHKVLVSFGWLTGISVLHEQGISTTLKSFRTFKYVLKCDDDSFVRVNALVSELQNSFSGSKGEYLYWGFFNGHAKVQKTGKYKEKEWNICDFYIPYALGGGYVLSEKLIHYIAKNGNFLKLFKSEDISVASWLATYNDINKVHDPRFDTEYISRGCHNSYLVTHKHSEIAMKSFQKNLETTGKLCQKEYRTRLSYIYNWQVPPSKCCARNNPTIP